MPRKPNHYSRFTFRKRIRTNTWEIESLHPRREEGSGEEKEYPRHRFGSMVEQQQKMTEKIKDMFVMKQQHHHT